MTHTERIFDFLATNPGAFDSTEISRHLEISGSSVSARLSEMHRNGLVTSQPGAQGMRYAMAPGARLPKAQSLRRPPRRKQSPPVATDAWREGYRAGFADGLAAGGRP